VTIDPDDDRPATRIPRVYCMFVVARSLLSRAWGSSALVMRARLVSTVGALGLVLVVACAACSARYGEQGGTSEEASTERASVGNDAVDAPDAAKAADNTKPSPPAPSGGTGSSGGAGDAGVVADASAADPTNCPGKTPATVGAWKPPPATSAACMAADITYFAGVAANQTWLGIESLMTTRHAACSKCIFSREADAQWRPLIFFGADGSALINSGACYARAPGGKDACGKAVYQWGDCYARVCDATACGSLAAQDACYASQAVYDACAPYDPTTACGGATTYASLSNVCNSYVDVARVLCAGGS
jgi:hypothetical protein